MNYIKQLNAFWIWRKYQSDISHSESDLYFALLHCANESGWKTQVSLPNSTLMATANIENKSQLSTLRNRLVQKGLIQYMPGKKGKAPVYIIKKLYDDESDIGTDIGSHNCTNQDTNMDIGSHNCTNELTNQMTNPDTNQMTNQTTLYKHKQNKNTKKEREKKDQTYNEILDRLVEDENLKAAYLEFIKMRKLIKKPMTNKALEMLIRKVDKLEPESIERKIELLDNAVLHNWQSVYPLKDNDFAKDGGERPDSAYCARNYDGVDDLPF